MMLDLDDLDGYFEENFTRTAFRLETLDQYEVASDGNDFGRYLAGAPEPDPERKQSWLDVLRAEVERGAYRHRVHILQSPLGDYLRYECEWGYAPNAKAGEDIRILDTAERSAPEGLPDHDFWLFDDKAVLRMHYDADGQFVGGEPLPDEAAPQYRAARDAAWEAAVSFDDYWTGHRQYWRDGGVGQEGNG